MKVSVNMVSHTHDNYVICRLPRAGLGNKLLVWARGLVFSELNQLPLLVSPWAQISLRSLLQPAKTRRFYFDYFTEQSIARQVKRLYVQNTYNCIKEPEITLLSPDEMQSKTIFQFEGLPHWTDLFIGLKSHRDFVKQEIETMLRQKYRQQLTQLMPPVISVHIRRGDFREMKDGEDFAKLGSARTPLKYFTDIIHAIRRFSRTDLPITVFSDGTADELEDILSIPNVSLMQPNAAIVDLLLMSQSKLIVFSAGSTFSYWAGFLSSAAILHHPDHHHNPLRVPSINERFFEGAIADINADFPDLLIKNINSLD